MIRSLKFRKATLWLGSWLLGSLAVLGWAQIQPSAGMIRFPDVSAEKIVFVYGEDLWTVDRAGGVAQPLASPAGEESLPRFSPDGATIAFVGNYDGNQDIYTIPVSGGPAQRVTYHPANELLCDWTPGGKLLFSSSAYTGLDRQTHLLTIAVDGSDEQVLPLPYGNNGALDAEGKWLAYTPYNADYRTWKRYRGGMAPDVWLFNLESKQSKQMTDFEGTDTIPMWHGSNVYYLSDAGPEHRLNIWRYDSKTGERKQVTNFSDHDCRWPSMGPGAQGQGEIVVTSGAHLFLIDLASEKSQTISITVPGDRPKIRPRTVNVAESVDAADLSPSAKRVVVSARGDLWTLPAKNGSPRNLTRTSGAAERDPAWSPDGRWIAYFSDVTGEYELYVIPADGSAPAERLTQDGNCYRYSPIWSPDSKWIAFSDKTGTLSLYSFATKSIQVVDREPTSGPVNVDWSHNSEWIAYSRTVGERAPSNAIFVFNVIDQKRHQLTAGFFYDAQPVFDRKGEHLFFASSRSFQSPKYEDLGTTFIYAGTEVLVALPLRGDVKYPFADESDEEVAKETKADKPEDKPADKPTTEPQPAAGEENKSDKPAAPAETADGAAEKSKEPADKKSDEPTVQRFAIEVENAEYRAFQIPVRPGNFGGIAVNDKGHLIYTRTPGRGTDGRPAIHLFDLTDKKREEKKVVEDRGQFVMSADGKKLLVSQRNTSHIIDAAADQKLTDAVPTEGMQVTVDPRVEWQQVFNEAWRIQRDFFYDPNMHGVNWESVKKQYSALLADCVSRRDVSVIISEMISELNVGHAYYREGDVERGPVANVGLLGARLERSGDAYRIAEIYRGAAWDVDARSPLELAGIKEGQFVHAVNGVALNQYPNLYAAFQRLGGLTVVLTISDQATLDGTAKKVPMKLLTNDGELRYRAWVERNRRYVAEKSNGRVGYIYVVNTGVPGQNELVRQFYGQLDKDALIIDDRWNGGGQIPTRFIELLNRPVTNYWARRDGTDWTWPPDSHQGPKCMLINGLAGSGGDMFPALFRQNKLGKLIGMRTWGGLVGISGGPTMVDGSSVTPPTFAFYETDGTWGIEGHGVDPDIRVVDDPALMQNGGDPQLDKAIEQMLSELQTSGYRKPPRPAYPDRSKMGLAPDDK